MRPGLWFRRVWTSAEAGALGPWLAEAIRGEFGAVFAVARRPALGSAGTGQLGASGTLSFTGEITGAWRPGAVKDDLRLSADAERREGQLPRRQRCRRGGRAIRSRGSRRVRAADSEGGLPVLWPAQDTARRRFVVLADPGGRFVVVARMNRPNAPARVEIADRAGRPPWPRCAGAQTARSWQPTPHSAKRASPPIGLAR